MAFFRVVRPALSRWSQRVHHKVLSAFVMKGEGKKSGCAVSGMKFDRCASILLPARLCFLGLSVSVACCVTLYERIFADMNACMNVWQSPIGNTLYHVRKLLFISHCLQFGDKGARSWWIQRIQVLCALQKDNGVAQVVGKELEWSQVLQVYVCQWILVPACVYEETNDE